MKDNIKPFKCVNWDFNHDKIEFHDVMPYLIREFEEEKERGYKIFCNNKEPKTFEDFKHFVYQVSRYHFWSRCEYEVIVTGWPVQKTQHKMDVYEQIEANIDVVTEVFMQNIGIKL